jgi:hypothetical protein
LCGRDHDARRVRALARTQKDHPAAPDCTGVANVSLTYTSLAKVGAQDRGRPRRQGQAKGHRDKEKGGRGGEKERERGGGGGGATWAMGVAGGERSCDEVGRGEEMLRTITSCGAG